MVYLILHSVLRTGFVPNTLSWVIRIWSLIIMLKMLFQYKQLPLFIKSLVILVLMFTCYGIIEIIQDKYYFAHDPPVKVTGYTYLNYIYKSLLPILVFYYFTTKEFITREGIIKWIPFFLLVATFGFFANDYLVKAEYGKDEITNNEGYTVLSIIPLLLLYKAKSKQQLFSYGYCLLIVLIGMKRGAIIISILTVILYFKYLLKNTSNKIAVYFVVLLFVGLTMISINWMMSTSDYFQERIEKTEEGNSSGRDDYYLFFIDYFLSQMDGEDLLFGLGANATLGIWSNYAHNDWLEIAINNGLLGLIVFLVFWLAFFKLCRKRCQARDIKTALYMLFVIYFMKTFFSMSYRDFTVYSSLMMGYCTAKMVAINKSLNNSIS